jgi:hypothetical protein
MWAMEGLPYGGAPWSLDEQLDRIAAAGYDGVNVSFTDAGWARGVCAGALDRGLRVIASGFPASVDGLRPILALVGEIGLEHVDHLNLQPNVRPRHVAEALHHLLGWHALAGDAGVPYFVETHRDRMTTDLHFTLDMLDAFPDLRLTADLSHFLVGREFPWPISEHNHELIRQVLRRSGAFHGRVATREQVQIQVSFAHLRPWLDLFAGWWEYGFAQLRATAPPETIVTFTTELGPPWYAITGADGRELSDRWSESLMIKKLVGDIWSRLEREGGA